MANKTDYLNMQNAHYEEYAKAWSLKFRDPVVGSYDAHNAWEDYDIYLFKDFNTEGLVALEYGCGPARNLIEFQDRFARVDGIDIAQTNLDKAKINLANAGIKDYNLYLTSGDNLDEVTSESYDVVFAVICFQHICVYEIRDSIIKDIYRVLKPGGHLCFQMGYGGKEGIPTAGYFDNVYEATTTNGHADVSITNEDDVKKHLKEIGYKNYKSDIRPTGPGDNHRNWIWIQVEK
jgi:ubiquinone/menaquinone biosynthesis C-methylase UbiE